MLISCHSDSTQSKKQLLRINSASGISSLDPAFARTQENIRAVNQLFNGLVQLDNQLNTIPCIAKKWYVTNHAKTYTFVLNDKVFFHNDPVLNFKDRAVIADDFVYSFNRIIDPNTASDGAWIFNDIVDTISPFIALNDSTLQINLQKPYAPFLNLLSMAYCFVVPKEAIEHYGPNFGKHPIGTGPFQFANWVDGIKLNLIKNDRYFESSKNNPIPKIDAVSISFIQSKQTELLRFIQGDLDLFTGIESSFKDELLTAEGFLNPKYQNTFQLSKFPFLNTEYLAFNLEDSTSPVNNLNFRKAIHHAIDRNAMISYLRNGVGKPANGGFIPVGLPNHQGYTRPYNPSLAKEFLVKSGIHQTEPIVLTTTSTYLDLCVLIQNNCSEIGIQIEIDVIPSSLLKQRKSSGELEFFRSSWIADYPDGENFMACFFSPNKAPNGPNYARYSNPTFDQYYKRLISSSDVDSKKDYFRQMERLLQQDQPFILLYYDESMWLNRNEIKNLTINPLNQLDLRLVRIVP